MRCPKCGGYGFDWEDRCTNCGYSVLFQKPPAWWGRKDFQSPDKTPEHGEKGEKQHHPDETDFSEMSEPELHDCPHCGEHSLFWNQHILMYECLNLRCRREITAREYKTNKEKPTKAQQRDDKQAMEASVGEQTPRKERPSETLEKCPECGQGMLRWNPAISKYECLYWKCRRTITKEYFESTQIPKPKRQLHLPRFNTISKITVCLLVLVGCAFVLLHGLTDLGQSGRSVIPVTSPTTSPASHNTPSPIPTPTPRVIAWPTATPLPAVRPITTPRVVIVTPRPLVPAQPTITQPSESGWVWVNAHTYLVGADGEPLVLVNNPSARNPSWSQLVDFLRLDPTDRMYYDDNSFTCGDFAEMLHNNAEKVGWRAALVSIDLTGSGGGHALNAFQTTDLGLVYIDCTGQPRGEPHPIYMDSRVELRVGAAYISECIFPEPDWYCTSPSMGVVTEIEVVQW